jgi:DNA polymerase III alpha subunit (gram-positive type)
MSFDQNIIGAELLRAEFPNYIAPLPKICTMRQTPNFCAIRSPYGGFKRPKLSELHYKLFNTHFEEAHNAAFDIEATARCFWELKKPKKI